MSNIDKLLIFDLIGKFAHFRKFYTNSSSLSYSFPPRTTVVGILAGILGEDRDSYYERFSIDKCKIAVSLRTPVRKIMQVVNYVNTAKSQQKKPSGIKAVNLSGGHTQIPLEIVLPKNDGKILRYRIYFYHRDPELFNKIKDTIENKKFHYPPYLGITEFIGEIEFIDCVKGDSIKKIENCEKIKISTALDVEYLKQCELEFDFDSEETLQYEKEKMPVDFGEKRILKKVSSFIFEKNAKSISLKNVFIPIYHIKYNYNNKEIEKNIVF